MEQFKRAKVIMLPTNNQNNLFIVDKKLFCYHKPQQGDGKTVINQQLYIISDDKTKESDWCYDSYNKDVYQVTAVVLHNQKSLEFNYLNKIIATTDNELGCGDNVGAWYSLPQPSQSFIERYIESYNKDKVITDVLVEYEEIYVKPSRSQYLEDSSPVDEYKTFLKVNPKNNTITIKKLKDSWNREEVNNLIKLFANNYQYASNDIGYNKWINDNL